MKKAFKWIGLILLSPILLFILLTILLYIPPIQKWGVDQLTEIASEGSGMQIAIDRIRLSFPLDLRIEGVKATREKDTIADMKSLTVDVQLLPLFNQRVVVNQLEINDIKLNTYELIPDVQVDGSVGCLTATSRGIDLSEGTVELNGALLADADITILLNDTAAVDTTTSEPIPWLINADSIRILRSRIEVHMPGDSMQVMAQIGQAKATNGNIDLFRSYYTVQHFAWLDGALAYDLPFERPMEKGLDYNHILLSDIQLSIDSVYFNAPNLGMKIQQAALKEKSGLQLTQLTGSVMMDSLGLRLPRMSLTTPHSTLLARALVDFNVMDSINPGRMEMKVDASLGKNDILLFLADMPEEFCHRWPEWPMKVRGEMSGTAEKATIEELDLLLPSAFHAKAFGTTANLNDPKRMLAKLNVEAETYDLGFAMALADKDIRKDYRIPSGLRMNGVVDIDGPRYNASMLAREGNGYVKAKGWFAENTMSYDATVEVSNLNLHHFMPTMTFYNLSADAQVKGQGTDFFKKTSWLDAGVQLKHLQYGRLSIDNMSASAQLKDGHAKASLKGDNDFMRGMFDVDALLKSKTLYATLSADMRKLDLYAMQLVEKELSVGMCGHLDFQSDFEDNYQVSGLIGEIYIKDSLNNYRPEDVGLTIRTQPDTTLIRMQSGDLIVKADASGGYKKLIDQCMTVKDSLLMQIHNRTLNQTAIKELLPTTRLYMTSGRNNPMSYFLRSSANTFYKNVNIDLSTSAEKGINGGMHIYSLNADSTRLDTIRMTFRDSSHGLTFQGQVTNNRRNPQFIFNALLDGHFHETGAVAGLRFFDERNRLALRVGAKASAERDGIRVNLMPERPNLGYREFQLNQDNFLYLGRDLKLQANINLMADDGSGIKIYSESQDSTLLQDLTVSLNRFDLDRLTTAIPYAPHIKGILDGDYHLIMDEEQKVSVSSDMQVAKLAYENSYVGNVSTEFVYMQREDDTHALQANMMLEGRDILDLNGSYKNEGPGYLDAILTFKKTPMNIVNGFVPEQIVGLEGYADGELAVKGATNRPQVDGEILLDSAYLISTPYGMRLRFDNDPVRIVNSQLLLENFTMYAYNENPLNIMGNIDFHNTEKITMNVRMRAQNFQLINAKQTKESIAYGKAYVNFFAYMGGELDELKMRGRIDVLGTTDVTYLLLDSPISTDNRLEELVKFTDFSDSTQTVVQKPTPDGLSVNMNISIDEGAHVMCGLNADRSNYVDLFGGGDLNMKYNQDGMSLTGRYTLTSGSMKYSLPIIPLKTFNIQDGSYVEFTGDMMNPRLNLTATERLKAPVAQEGSQSRSVEFDCGVVITKTLQDMGLEFIITAPEDMTIASELYAMSAEQRSKLAVTMLTTGMYANDNNVEGLSVNSALSSFLQSEINNITGSALKTVDLSVGLDNTTDASGEMRTDYSFKFAKRFWNNRLKVQIGGKISSDTQSQVQGQKQNFFDNVSMEYRLTPTSNQYVKLFYSQNVYDWLDGYTSEYGGGYIYKRKLNSLLDILRLWGKDRQTNIPQRTMMNRGNGNASQRNDSIKNNAVRSNTTRTDTLKTTR